MEKFAATIQIESSGPLDDASNATAAKVVTRTKAESDVQVLKTCDYRAAALCLAEAFKDDVACSYYLNCPDTASWTAEQKWTLHLRTFECIVYAHILSGLALGAPSSTSPGEYDAVALWMPPGKNMDDLFTMIRSGFWMLQWRYSSIGKARFFDEFLPLLHITKEQVMKERDSNSWYLVYLGTRSAARGKGLAGKLVRSVTEKADAAGLACYLESTSKANLTLYRRLGFEERTSIQLKDKSIVLDIMVREPVYK